MVRGAGRGPGDEHAGALAAALLLLLLPRPAVAAAVAGGVVEQRVGRWRQHRRATLLLRHMVAESLAALEKTIKPSA